MPGVPMGMMLEQSSEGSIFCIHNAHHFPSQLDVLEQHTTPCSNEPLIVFE
jgi:hypothetical protein